MTLSSRFVAKVDWPAGTPTATMHEALHHVAEHHADGCVFWSAAKSSGYGVVGLKNRNLYAHRLALSVVAGPPRAPDLCALHSCDNPACVNPAHLRWGTKKDNLHDAQSRGRFPVPEQANPGERNGQSKFTDADVLDVRARLRDGESMSSIARSYGVTPGAVSHIKHGRAWTHVQLESAS